MEAGKSSTVKNTKKQKPQDKMPKQATKGARTRFLVTSGSFGTDELTTSCNKNYHNDLAKRILSH